MWSAASPHQRGCNTPCTKDPPPICASTLHHTHYVCVHRERGGTNVVAGMVDPRNHELPRSLPSLSLLPTVSLTPPSSSSSSPPPQHTQKKLCRRQRHTHTQCVRIVHTYTGDQMGQLWRWKLPESKLSSRMNCMDRDSTDVLSKMSSSVLEWDGRH